MSIAQCGIVDLGARRGASRPRAHLVGIAGSGMCAMAEVLLGWGWQLTGSDIHCEAVSSLADAGIRLFQGHAAENLAADTELVISSDAVAAENPELQRARELGIPVVSYFQAIGQLSADRPTLAVAGTHGKSTTTAMAAHMLMRAGCHPTVFCGAAMPGRTSGGQAGRQGEGSLLLVEACEYRANFLHLRPRHAVILGIEPDHFDCYDSLGALERAFSQFAASTPSDGLMLARHDCPSTRRAVAGVSCRVETFGLDADADWSAREVGSTQGRYRFAVWYRGHRVAEVQLPVPGRHNVLNALAALALVYHHGVSAEQAAVHLAEFPGLQRRLEISDLGCGVTLIDDYAHHPTAVFAALAAVRDLLPDRRVWCVFQPHQASRTARLLDELAASLQNADKVLITDIFRAREGSPRPGEVTAADLAARTRSGGVEVLSGHSSEEIAETLETHLVPGDVLVILGAGDTARLRPFQKR